MISIYLNRELDLQVYEDFRNFSIGGVDFGKMIREDHPLITVENYKEYINKYYDDHADEIRKSLTELNNLLESKEALFSKFIKKIFGELSNNGIRGYFSIFNCNPRYLEERTFQIYYKKDLLSKLEVCFHEILHFNFFDYCDKKLARETGGLDKNSGPLWELSEVLNVILMNDPEFRKFSDREEMLFYPQFKEKLDIAKNIWVDCNHRVDKFIPLYLGLRI